MHHPCNILILLGKHNIIEEIAWQIQNTELTNERGKYRTNYMNTSLFIFYLYLSSLSYKNCSTTQSKLLLLWIKMTGGTLVVIIEHSRNDMYTFYMCTLGVCFLWGDQTLPGLPQSNLYKLTRNDYKWFPKFHITYSPSWWYMLGKDSIVGGYNSLPLKAFIWTILPAVFVASEIIFI